MILKDVFTKLRNAFFAILILFTCKSLSCLLKKQYGYKSKLDPLYYKTFQMPWRIKKMVCMQPEVPLLTETVDGFIRKLITNESSLRATMSKFSQDTHKSRTFFHKTRLTISPVSRVKKDKLTDECQMVYHNFYQMYSRIKN